MISTLLTLAAVVACTIAYPVVHNCMMTPDLFAYCNNLVNETTLKNSTEQLYYKESNDMIDELEKVCKKTMCGNYCHPRAKISVTDDRDEQNDAVYSQMRTLKKQLLLLDDHCITVNNTEDNTTTLGTILCEIVQSGLHHFTQQITDYLEIQKCGCNDHCNYTPGKMYKKPEGVTVEQLFCKLYNTVLITQDILAEIQKKWTSLSQ